MKHCPKCNKEHNKPGIFCSRSCANARTWTPEQNTKRGKSVSAAWEKIDAETRRVITANSVQKSKEAREFKILNTDTTELSTPLIRKKIAIEQKYSCLFCNLSLWLDEPITLELDHINGDNTDNRRGNLRMLCPNCHSTTPTWKTGNKPHWKHRMLP
jgi:hypothetical protein